jgi:pSer/pThr/pTyr-binding forkhead associated (FHA) protein
MPVRLVALDEGPDIPVDRAMMVVGRHPQCDARLDSIRVSRRHCCMTSINGEVEVKDLGSTNGIRINGQRVEVGRLKPGDELSIAHIRFRLDGGQAQEMTVADPMGAGSVAAVGGSLGGGDRPDGHHAPFRARNGPPTRSNGAPADNPLAAAVRDLLPSALADKCRIQVIVQMKPEHAGPDAEAEPADQGPDACQPASSR